MERKNVLYILLFLVIVGVKAEIQQIELPLVSKRLQDDINFQMNFLKLLVPTYNWLFCNKVLLSKTVHKTSLLLHEAAEEMKLARGTVYVDGTDNQIVGYSNVIIGSNNKFVGVKSWCFISNYQTPKNTIDQGILAIGNYKINLLRVDAISQDPRQAISPISAQEFEELRLKNAGVSFFFK